MGKVETAAVGTWEHRGVRYGIRRWDGPALAGRANVPTPAGRSVCDLRVDEAAGRDAYDPCSDRDANRGARDPRSGCIAARDMCECAAAPIVLLHGFAQSAASWDGVARLLAKACPVIAFEFAGHGGSDCPRDPASYALEAQAEALHAFLAGFETKPVVVGYSMGGRIALAAAVRDPRAFAAHAAALVLESVGLGPADDNERAASARRDAANAARLRADGLAAFMEEWERLPLFATQRALPSDVRERVRAERMSADAEALARSFEHAGQHAMPARADVLAALAALRDEGLPVQYVAGACDAKYRALAALLAAEGLCASRVIEAAGHNVHLEKPAAFVQVVRQLGR